MNLWKYTGVGSVIYTAAIAGIDPTYFEVAALDGARRRHTIRFIILPLPSFVIIVQVISGLGRIFNSDFGLFFQVAHARGALTTSRLPVPAAAEPLLAASEKV